ncbi:unnamed protein product [Urochloa humidicola]
MYFAKKKGLAKCSFSVMKLRAEVVVSPDQKLSSTDDADLTLEMEDLSLPGENKDASPRIGYVSKGMLSEFKNNVPDVW